MARLSSLRSYWLRLGFCITSFGPLAQGTSASYPPASTTCATTSGNTTGWEIKNFIVDTDSKLYYGRGTLGKVSFSVKNSANGYEFSCAQGSSRSVQGPNFSLKDGRVWYSCNSYCYGPEVNPPLDTSFSFDIDTKALDLRQKWSCAIGNNSSIVTYLGTGSAVAANLSCQQIPGRRQDQVSCMPTDIHVKASTVSVINGTANSAPEDEDAVFPPRGDGRQPPYQSVPPSVSHDNSSCIARSQLASWNVGRILYTGQGIRFMITNTALNYTTQCNIQDVTDRIRTENPFWRNCTRYNTARATYPNDGIYTEVLYGGNGDVLGINQTWYCDDNSKAQATIFSASAQTAVRYNCNETRACYTARAPETQPTIDIRDYCDHPGMVLTPNKTTMGTMSLGQARALFTPHGYNCTDRSLGLHGAPSWTIADFTFSRTWNPDFTVPGFSDEVTFSYNNTAVNSDWPMITGLRECYDKGTEWAPLFGGQRELRCSSGQRDLMHFDFDYNSSKLTLGQLWGCDSRDRDHANYFNATAAVTLPLECKPDGNGTRCTVPDRISVPMTNVTSTIYTLPETWDAGF